MIFKSTTELKRYAQLTGDINFESLRATLQFVETFHLRPILGLELYTALNEAYNTNESSMSDAHKALLQQCRLMAGPYLCYYYAPKADVQLTDAGMTKSKEAAYQYQVRNFREANLREAEMCEEALLSFLEKNKGDYQQWADSDNFKEYRSLFIKTGFEFNHLFSSSSPQRNYAAMRSKMVDVEEQMIRMAIGDTLFATLKTKDAGNQDFTDKEKELLFKLKKAIANQTVFLSIPVLNVRIDAAGLSVVARTVNGSSDEDNMRSTTLDAALSQLMSACETSAKAWIRMAKEYIANNDTDFNTVAPVITPLPSINSELKGSFGMY